MDRHLILILILLGLAVSNCNRPQNNGRSGRENTIADTLATITQISEQIRQEPENASLFFERAKKYLLKGDLLSALNDLKIAVKLDQSNAEYAIHLADLYLKTGESGLSKETLEQSIEFNPGNTKALHRLANIYFYVQDYTKAMEWLNKTQEADRNYAPLYFTKGMIYKETGDTAIAIRNFQVATEKEPDYYDAYIMLGLLHTELKDTLAIAYYENAKRIIPSSIEARYNLAMFFQENNYIRRALNEYGSIITEVDSLQPNIYFNQAYVFMVHLNNYPDAVRLFSKAIELNPGFISAFYNRGYCFEQMKNYEAASQDYRKCLTFNENYELAIEGLNRIDLMK